MEGDKEIPANKPNTFRVIAQMKKSSLEKRNQSSQEGSSSNTPTPDNSCPPSRTNSMRAIARFKHAMQQKNASVDRSNDLTEKTTHGYINSPRSNSPTSDNVVEPSTTSKFKRTSFKRTSIKRRSGSNERSIDETVPETPGTPTSALKGIARFKRASLKKREASSLENSSQNSPQEHDEDVPSKANTFRAIAKFKQASIEKRSNSSGEKSIDEDSRPTSPVEVTEEQGTADKEPSEFTRESKTTNSFRAIAKFKHATGKRNQSATSKSTNDEPPKDEAKTSKEIQRVKEQGNKPEKAPMKRQNSLKIITSMKIATSTNKNMTNIAKLDEKNSDGTPKKASPGAENNNMEGKEISQNPYMNKNNNIEIGNTNDKSYKLSSASAPVVASPAASQVNKNSRSSVARRWPPANDNIEDGNDDGNLVVAELKEGDIRSSLRKTKQSGKGQSTIFFGSSSPTPASGNQQPSLVISDNLVINFPFKHAFINVFDL